MMSISVTRTTVTALMFAILVTLCSPRSATSVEAIEVAMDMNIASISDSAVASTNKILDRVTEVVVNTTDRSVSQFVTQLKQFSSLAEQIAVQMINTINYNSNNFIALGNQISTSMQHTIDANADKFAQISQQISTDFQNALNANANKFIAQIDDTTNKVSTQVSDTTAEVTHAINAIILFSGFMAFFFMLTHYIPKETRAIWEAIENLFVISIFIMVASAVFLGVMQLPFEKKNTSRPLYASVELLMCVFLCFSTLVVLTRLLMRPLYQRAFRKERLAYVPINEVDTDVRSG